MYKSGEKIEYNRTSHLGMKKGNTMEGEKNLAVSVPLENDPMLPISEVFNQPNNPHSAWLRISIACAPPFPQLKSTGEDTLMTSFQMVMIWGSGLARGLSDHGALLATLRFNFLRCLVFTTFLANLHLVISWDINQSKRDFLNLGSRLGILLLNRSLGALLSFSMQ